MKRFAKKGRRERQYEVKDYVFPKIQPYHFSSLASCPNEKLSSHFYDPYEIIEMVG